MSSLAASCSSTSLMALATPAVLQGGVNQVDKWLNWGFKVAGVDISVGSVLGAILLFLAFWIVAVLLKRALRRYGKHNHQINQSTLYTAERLLHYLLLFIGVLVALSFAGIPTSKMTVFAGALGVGLGFGLQAIFNNFISGLILLFDRSLKVGDFVELTHGVHGHVREIRIRATLISTNDDIDILVPNAEFVTGRVVNWTLREVARRQRIPFHVAYGVDKERVKKAALEAAESVPFTLTMEGARAPQAWLTGFGESSLDFELVVWLNAEATRRVGAVTAAYNWALHTALEKYGIEIPFPQRDLHVRSWSRAPREEDSRQGRPQSAATTTDHDNDAARDVEFGIAEESARRAAQQTSRTPDANR